MVSLNPQVRKVLLSGPVEKPIRIPLVCNLFRLWKRGEWLLVGGRTWVWLRDFEFTSHSSPTITGIVDDLFKRNLITPVTETHYAFKLQGPLYYFDYLTTLKRKCIITVDDDPQGVLNYV